MNLEGLTLRVSRTVTTIMESLKMSVTMLEGLKEGVDTQGVGLVPAVA